MNPGMTTTGGELYVCILQQQGLNCMFVSYNGLTIWTMTRNSRRQAKCVLQWPRCMNHVMTTTGGKLNVSHNGFAVWIMSWQQQVMYCKSVFYNGLAIWIMTWQQQAVICMSVSYNGLAVWIMTTTDGELYVCILQWLRCMNHDMTTTGGELYVCILQWPRCVIPYQYPSQLQSYTLVRCRAIPWSGPGRGAKSSVRSTISSFHAFRNTSSYWKKNHLQFRLF